MGREGSCFRVFSIFRFFMMVKSIRNNYILSPRLHSIFICTFTSYFTNDQIARKVVDYVTRRHKELGAAVTLAQVSSASHHIASSSFSQCLENFEFFLRVFSKNMFIKFNQLNFNIFHCTPYFGRIFRSEFDFIDRLHDAGQGAPGAVCVGPRREPRV